MQWGASRIVWTSILVYFSLTAIATRRRMDLTKPKHIALFLAALSGGGSERVFLNLARVFCTRGYRVDILVARLRGQLASEIPESVRMIELGIAPMVTSIWTYLKLPLETFGLLLPAIVTRRPKKLRCFPGLRRYLLVERPDVLVATTHVPNLLALWGAWLTRVKTRVIIRQANSLPALPEHSGDPLEHKLPVLMKQWYRHSSGIIAVSQGLAEELSQLEAVPKEGIQVIYNPVDSEGIAEAALEEPDHPWFQPGQPAVIIAAGRLHAQKDYPTMLRAFAGVRAKRKVRLVILGEGHERGRLEALIRELGVAEDVRLLGFQRNPYAYISRAAVFVMSSVWEGFPNVLLEALACGCPIVSTDCAHGPFEVLDGGRYGRLVPVSDHAALAAGILATLDAPRESEKLKSRAEMFPLHGIASEYLEVLLNQGHMDRTDKFRTVSG